MTALTPPLGRLRRTFTDGLTLVGREPGRLRREPGQIVAVLFFPAVMVVLFGYVFGSAIAVPGGGDYREHLMPGLFSMVTFTAVQGGMARKAAVLLWSAALVVVFVPLPLRALMRRGR